MIKLEKYCENYPNPVSLKSTEKIIEQMKNNVCRIYLNEGSKGTGFFCKIPYNNKFLHVLMTNNHVIDEKELKRENILISINNNQKKIELENRMKYTNKEYDITIIEIKNKDEINNYLEIEDNIMKNLSNEPYIKESIYIIQYEGKKKEVSVSYGIIQNIDKENNFTFEHLCSTDNGSSGSPILNIETNKIIGIHKDSRKDNNYNRGTFLNDPIKEYIKKKMNISIYSIYSIKGIDGIFSFLNEKRKLNMIINNKKLQKLLLIDIKNYKKKSGKYIIGKKMEMGKNIFYIQMN